MLYKPLVYRPKSDDCMPDSGLMVRRLRDEFIPESVSTEPRELGCRRVMKEMERAALLLAPRYVD